MADGFNCCVQCQDFDGCKCRTESSEKNRPLVCCESCRSFELCKIVSEKIRL